MEINIKEKKEKGTFKTIVVIRKDLKLSKTEMLVQSNYATMELLKSFMKKDKQLFGKNVRYIIETVIDSPLDVILSNTDEKEFYFIENEDNLLHLYNKIKISNIPVVLVEDTDIRGNKGNKVKTCLALIALDEKAVSNIMGHLDAIQ